MIFTVLTPWLCFSLCQITSIDVPVTFGAPEMKLWCITNIQAWIYIKYTKHYTSVILYLYLLLTQIRNIVLEILNNEQNLWYNWCPTILYYSIQNEILAAHVLNYTIFKLKQQKISLFHFPIEIMVFNLIQTSKKRKNRIFGIATTIVCFTNFVVENISWKIK